MRNFILVFAIISALAAPQITFAAWWNPISWFRSEQTLKSVESRAVSELETRAIKPSQNESEEAKEITPTLPKERVIEKTVEKTITVDNPNLQTEINTLIIENRKLRAKIDELHFLNSSLVSSLNTLREEKKSVVTVTLNGEELERKRKLEALDAKLLALLENFSTISDGYANYESVPPRMWDTLPDPQEVNGLLDAYRALDPKFVSEKIKGTIGIVRAREYGRLLSELRSYIAYRKLINEL